MLAPRIRILIRRVVIVGRREDEWQLLRISLRAKWTAEETSEQTQELAGRWHKSNITYHSKTKYGITVCNGFPDEKEELYRRQSNSASSCFELPDFIQNRKYKYALRIHKSTQVDFPFYLKSSPSYHLKRGGDQLKCPFGPVHLCCSVPLESNRRGCPKD